MDTNGSKTTVFFIWFFHPRTLSSVRWANYRTVQPELNTAIDKLLFLRIVSSVLPYDTTSYFHFMVYSTFGLPQLYVLQHCSKTKDYFNHINRVLGILTLDEGLTEKQNTVQGHTSSQ